MSSVTAPPPARARPRALDRLAVPVAAGRRHALPFGAAAFLALVTVSVWLRTRALDAAFWMDEGLSVGIASFPLDEIPGVLREDGSPPVFYALLHLWMRAFGTSETATHLLSLVFAVLTVPAALWAGRSLYGARTGWYAAGLAALSPFLTFYAQETRMYALQTLLGLLVAATFLHAFVLRDRHFVALFAAAMSTMLYTHNWTLFLAGGTVIALALLWRVAAPVARRGLLRDGLLGYGAIALLFAPWLPTLAFQVQHTGAPWSERPDVEALLSAVGLLLGGATPAVALLLVGGNGLASLVRDGRDRRALALVALTASAILLAFLASQVSPAFANRYFAAFAGPLLLLAAVGLSHSGRLGVVCLLVVAAFWLDPRTGQLRSKSNVRSVGTSIQTLVTPGDLVVSTHPEQLPLIAYYLPKGVRYANSLGPVREPRYFAWTDALQRLRAAKPEPTINRLVATLRPGQDLVLVQPLLRSARWGAPWTALVRRRSVQWERRLDHHPRVRREAIAPVFGYDRPPKGVRAIVYRVVDDGRSGGPARPR